MKKPVLSLPEFIAAIDELNVPVISKTAVASYSALRRTENILHFKRDNTGKYWRINLNELYKAYGKLDYINTVNIRQYVRGQVYSPACAILISLGLYTKKGEKI